MRSENYNFNYHRLCRSLFNAFSRLLIWRYMLRYDRSMVELEIGTETMEKDFSEFSTIFGHWRVVDEFSRIFSLYTPPLSCQSWFYSRWKKRWPQPVTFSAGGGGGGIGPVYKSCIPQYTLARAVFGLMSTAENETSTNGGSVPPPRRRSFLSFTRNIFYYSKYIFNARSPLTETISNATSNASRTRRIFPIFLHPPRFSFQFYKNSHLHSLMEFNSKYKCETLIS